jgi:hypothetical protein
MTLPPFQMVFSISCGLDSSWKIKGQFGLPDFPVGVTFPSPPALSANIGLLFGLPFDFWAD